MMTLATYFNLISSKLNKRFNPISFMLDFQAKKRHGGAPWNLSFSWSAAIQLPLLALCKVY